MSYSGLKQVEENADQEWLEYAWQFLMDYMATHTEVFCDDLWDAGLTPPRESRALGVIIARAARQRLLEKSGEYRNSVRSNSSDKPVWRVVV